MHVLAWLCVGVFQQLLFFFFVQESVEQYQKLMVSTVIDLVLLVGV